MEDKIKEIMADIIITLNMTENSKTKFYLKGVYNSLNELIKE